VSLPADHQPHPVLQMDELWSYVGSKANPVWIWLALESRTRRIVSFAFGDRSEQTAQQLYQGLPTYYQQQGIFFTHAWKSYNILPAEQHFAINRSTNHIERFNATLRQGCSNLVRKTLSFSKSEAMHQHRILKFINYYNYTISP
jgi:IS1 family transposase